MAWRIESHLVRGEIDNRVRDRVTGRLWFLGRKEPVELDLEGNAARDLAGRRIEFVNPAPKPGLDTAFAGYQTGLVGDMTASRKVRVPDIPLEQIGRYYEEKRAFPWHWGNSVYFEWYSRTNGRVVIESADFQLVMAPEIAWELSAEEEKEQRAAGAEAVERFFEEMGRPTFPGVSEVELSPTPKEDFDSPFASSDDSSWLSDAPMTEEEADELMADSDRLTDRLMARLDEAGPDGDLEAILEEELERRRHESNRPPLTPEEEQEREAWIDEMSRRAEEIANDPELEEELARQHPLAQRARELSLLMMGEFDGGTWALDPKAEKVVTALLNAATKAGGKLAGALDGREWPPLVHECGLCIAWLKRARRFLNEAATAAEVSRAQKFIPRDRLDYFYGEILAIRSEVDSLIEMLRDRLARGFD